MPKASDGVKGRRRARERQTEHSVCRQIGRDKTQTKPSERLHFTRSSSAQQQHSYTETVNDARRLCSSSARPRIGPASCLTGHHPKMSPHQRLAGRYRPRLPPAYTPRVAEISSSLSVPLSRARTRTLTHRLAHSLTHARRSSFIARSPPTRVAPSPSACPSRTPATTWAA